MLENNWVKCRKVTEFITVTDFLDNILNASFPKKIFRENSGNEDWDTITIFSVKWTFFLSNPPFVLRKESISRKISELDHHTVEKREFYCHTNFFPWNQFIVKLFSKTLLWRNFCEKTMAAKFQNLHSVSTFAGTFPHFDSNKSASFT